MDDLEYSNDALEVISDFYNCDFTVYVEGEDDVIFWENIFSLSNKNVHIEEVGGISELNKYIDKIVDDGVDIYVAKDNDYNDFESGKIIHEKIFRTYGHSIENTLYNFNTIKSIIKNFSRISGNLSHEVEEEFNLIVLDFQEKIRPLLVLEIANEIYQKGISILGINTCKFLKNNKSVILCEDKMNNFIEINRTHFEDHEIETVNRKIDEIGKPIWYLIRGHFLTNFVTNLIKKIVCKISSKIITLPTEIIYPLFIDIKHLASSDDIQHYNLA